MPQSDPPSTTGSAFEIVTPSKSKKTNVKSIIIIAAVFLFLGVAVFLGVYLVQQQQQISEKAAGGPKAQCPAAEACPYPSQPDLLRNCHPGEVDNTPKEYLCQIAGTVRPCGSQQTNYCCPAPGAAWTTNMSVCNSLAAASTSPSPTPNLQTDNNNCGNIGFICSSGKVCQSGQCVAVATPTASPIPTSTIAPLVTQSPVTASPAPTQSPAPASISRTATPVPIPVTGVEWPTILGVGVGVATIIGSILLAI